MNGIGQPVVDAYFMKILFAAFCFRPALRARHGDGIATEAIGVGCCGAAGADAQAKGHGQGDEPAGEQAYCARIGT